MDTPVAFFIFNRPDLTNIVFSEIRRAQPERLFVIADGPRDSEPQDAHLCNSARDILKSIDWNCEVATNLSDTNMGLGLREASGIDWVFEQVDKAIFLEDDTKPNPRFFQFCEELLNYYENDESIMSISGTNTLRNAVNFKESYYYSRYPRPWGWASWKRAWDHYDVKISDWPEMQDQILSTFTRKTERKFWKTSFDRIYDGDLFTWDHQWRYALFKCQGLAITPSENLISNIGFGKNATHTRNTTSPFSNLPTHSLDFPLVHPEERKVNHRADALVAKHFFSGNYLESKFWRLVSRAKMVLGK